MTVTPSDGRPALGGSGSRTEDVPSAGRVVRLRFACRAPLPLGYSLRVTSSTLWAPCSQGAIAGDDAAAAAVSLRAGDAAYHSGGSNAAGGSVGLGSSNVHDSAEVAAAAAGSEEGGGSAAAAAAAGGAGSLYASSVEMVTSPDSYPVWRTRRPVVCVVGPPPHHGRRGGGSTRSLGSARSLGDSPSAGGGGAGGGAGAEGDDDGGAERPRLGRVQHHRYRYLIVSPGLDAAREVASVPASSSDSALTAVEAMEAMGGGMAPSASAAPSSAAASPSAAKSGTRAFPPGPSMDRADSDVSVSEELRRKAERKRLEHPILSGRDGGGTATTCEDGGGVLPVVMWEDPFYAAEVKRERDEGTGGGGGESSHGLRSSSSSSSSLPRRGSAGGGLGSRTASQRSMVMSSRVGAVRDAAAALRELANLPYRTVDVDARTGRVLSGLRLRRAAGSGSLAEIMDSGDGGEGGEGEGGDDHDDDDDDDDDEDDVEHTEDGVRIDVWQREEDYAFRPYVVREAINRQNRLKNNLAAVAADDDDICTSSSGSDYADAADAASPSVEYYAGAGPTCVPSSAADTPSPSPRARAKQRIFFVCFHLPVAVRKDPITEQWTATWAESLMARTEGSDVVRRNEARWIGTVDPDPPISSAQDREAVRAVLAGMDCTPLFIEREVRVAHYYGMCKQILWPAFHNIDLLDICTSTTSVGTAGAAGSWSSSSDADADTAADGSQHRKSGWDQGRLGGWWDAYVSVNRAFAGAVSAATRPGDIVWVHDYHLSLLPKMTYDGEVSRYGAPSTKKVFFLHIPFCSSVMFKELECGDALLRGMIHADVVGFHTFDYTRHFLSAAKRLIGINYESLVGGLIGLKYRGRTVLVTMHNVSVEPRIVDAALSLPTVESGARALKDKYPNRALIAGVEIGQSLSGVRYKLLAFDELLREYPVWRGRVTLVQRCLIPGSRRSDEAATIREVRYLVRRMRATYGRDSIDYEEIAGSSLPVDRRLSLWTASDLMMVTAVREGLNLLPLEYIYARKGPGLAPGIIVASEFSAVCSILNGAIRVNPFDVHRTASAIDKALTMNPQEREGRRLRDVDFVSSSPSSKWAENVLKDMEDAAQYARGDDGTDDSDDAVFLGAGGGGGGLVRSEKREVIDCAAAFLARENELSFSHLDNDSVIRAYKSTSRRVIIMDFNGTIVIKEPPGKYLKRDILGSSGNKPPAAVVKALTDLAADPKNTVFVVSGDAKGNLESALGTVPNLGLAASNGACFAPPLRAGETGARTWRTFDLGVDWEAVKRVALPIMSKYTARTNGSFVKLTHSSLGWSYYSCDPEWGLLQASHLVPELEGALRAFDVRFVTLKGVIEVVPRMLNKGLIVKKVLREVAARNGGDGVDFILCMGDDISDEKMFTAVFSFASEMNDDVTTVMPSPDVITDAGTPVLSPGATTTTTASTSSSFDDDVPTVVDELPLKRRLRVDPLYAFTAAVGKKPTHASHYVNDAWDVAALLVGLSGNGELSSIRTASFGGDDGDDDEGADFFA